MPDSVIPVSLIPVSSRPFGILFGTKVTVSLYLNTVYTDTIDVYVEVTAENFSDNLGVMTKKEKALVGALKAMLGILVNVHLVQPKTITRSEGKAVRVIDKRKLV